VPSVVPRNTSSPLKPLLIAVGCYLLFVVYGSHGVAERLGQHQLALG